MRDTSKESPTVADVRSQAQWFHLDEKLKSNLFENIKENAIRQGRLKVSYLVAPLNAMAESPDNIMFLFHEDADIKYGAVTASFYVLSRRFPVLIDTMFPFTVGTR